MTHSTTTQPVGFINFHGLMLLVVRYQEVDYVSAKALSDLAGTDWRNTKKALTSGDNVQLFDTKRLPNHPFLFKDGFIEASSSSLGDASTPQNAANSNRDTVLCIRLDRARMYLARINTNQMRVQGNENGADKLLALQIEWAKVLHDYETQGYAVKDTRKNSLSEIINLIKVREKANVAEQRWITALIEEQARDLGIDTQLLSDPQSTFNL